VLEEALWTATARENHYALACNTGSADCQIHRRAHMQANAPTDEERARLRAMVLRIANDWGRRCGADCVERWNATAGKAIGVSIADP